MTSAVELPREAVVVLRNVVAKDRAGVKGAARGMIFSLSLDVGLQSIAILGTPEDGALALFEVLSGKTPPDRGTVRVGGLDPWSSPALRARIGAVGLEPSLPDAGTVAQTIDLVTAPWKSRPGAAKILDPMGLGSLAMRRVATLTAAEARAVEIAIACALPEPLLLVMQEPFAGGADVTRGRLEDALAAASQRAAVIVITSAPADAKRSPRTIVLHRGALVRATEGTHADLAPPLDASVTVWVDAGARELAAQLARSAAVTSSSFDAKRGTQDGGVLRLTGADADALALAIADAVQSSGATIAGMSEAAPGVAEIRAMTESEIRSRHMAVEQARVLEAQRAVAMRQQAHYTPYPGHYGHSPQPPAVTPHQAPPPAAPAVPAMERIEPEPQQPQPPEQPPKDEPPKEGSS